MISLMKVNYSKELSEKKTHENSQKINEDENKFSEKSSDTKAYAEHDSKTVSESA